MSAYGTFGKCDKTHLSAEFWGVIFPPQILPVQVSYNVRLVYSEYNVYVYIRPRILGVQY